MKIFHATAEFFPYIKMGGLSDMLSSLSKQQSETHEVSVALPLIRNLKVEPNFTGNTFSAIHPNSILGAESSFILRDSIFREAKFGNVTLYFFDSPLFNSLDKIYENPDEHYRFALFSYACFHLSLSKEVDIVHCHDWHTALTTYFHSSSTIGLPTIFTIHNLAYQGDHPEYLCGFLQGEPFYLNLDILKHDGKINYLKGAVSVSKRITTVSPGYRDEVLWEPNGCGLSYNLRQRGKDFLGILNGIDSQEWNPASDKNLDHNFDLLTVSQGKIKNKTSLYNEIKRDINPSRPLIGLIGRLTWQKGYRTFLESFKNKTRLPFFYVFLGSGDPELENELFYHSHHSLDRLFFYKGYSESFARKIEASSDFFLMPSLFEPCGLNQLYSHAYGSIPIVSRVGGLKDTVIEDPYDLYMNTGLLFEPGDHHSLDYALERANTLYNNSQQLIDIRSRIMKLDWSWSNRFKEYTNVYKSMLAEKS